MLETKWATDQKWKESSRRCLRGWTDFRRDCLPFSLECRHHQWTAGLWNQNESREYAWNKKKNPNNLEIPWWCPDEPQTKLGIHFHPHPPFLNNLAKSIPSLTDNIMGSAFPLMSVCPSTFCSYNKMPEVAFFFFFKSSVSWPMVSDISIRGHLVPLRCSLWDHTAETTSHLIAARKHREHRAPPSRAHPRSLPLGSTS